MGFKISKMTKNYIHKTKNIISHFTSKYIPMVTLGGDVEIDEIFIRGRQKYNNGNNAKYTNIIFGIYSRTTKEVLLFHIPNKSAQSIHPILSTYLDPGTRIFSDKMICEFSHRKFESEY
jgi:hypothetical protein